MNTTEQFLLALFVFRRVHFSQLEVCVMAMLHGMISTEDF